MKMTIRTVLLLCITYHLATAQNYHSVAEMEVILHDTTGVRTTKYIRGYYSAFSTVLNVEGDIEQVGTVSSVN